MRLKLLLITLSTIAFTYSAFAQKVDNSTTLTDEQKRIDNSEEVILFSKGKMYIESPKDAQGAKVDKTTMLVVGAVKYADGAAVKQDGETAITGDFINALQTEKTAIVGGKTVLVVDSLFGTNDTGRVTFIGQNNKQTIRREVPAAGSKRSKNYYQINFPNIKVDKKVYSNVFPKWNEVNDAEKNLSKIGYVAVDTSAAIRVNQLDISDKNRFSVEVHYDTNNATQVGTYALNSGYADIKLLKDNDGGSSQVDMKLYDKANVDNTNTKNTATFMRGFSSPFEKLPADYMFFHVLTRPNQFSLTSFLGPIADPKTILQQGVGYFMAMDVGEGYKEEIVDNWFGQLLGKPGFETVDKIRAARAQGGYNFSRRLHNDYYHSDPVTGKYFSLYTNDQGVGERFNTKDVTVTLNGKGVHFLGNPFMTPINISGILGSEELYAKPVDEDNRFTVAGLEVKSIDGGTTGAFSATMNATLAQLPIVRAQYHVISEAYVKRVKYGAQHLYAYNVKYDLMSILGARPTLPAPETVLIEPMQMFLIQTNNSLKFTFKVGDKDIRSSKGVRYNHSADYTMPSLPSNVVPANAARASVNEEISDDVWSDKVRDWFIVQSKSSSENGQVVDRTTVGFIERATLSYDTDYDEKKQIANPNITEETKATLRSLAGGRGIGSEAKVDITPSNVLYTQSSDGAPLLSNGIPFGTKEVPLFYLPNEDKDESVTFSTYGLDQLDQVEGVWLIDKFDNNRTVKLEPGEEYSFSSKPLDEKDKAENRFILRFYDGDDEGEGNEPSINEKPITCYYSGSVLHISGLNEKDMGSAVEIFDLQGRLMGKTTVNNNPSMEYPKTLGLGTFVVKITGKRNYTTKFVNLQNY